MADIQAFKGITYDHRRVPLERVISPPYDVLSPADQEELYARDPHNIVRVILNRPEPGDDELAPYARAARFLNEWLASGIMAEDSEPALYLYHQVFTNPADGRRFTRRGFFCALKLEPYSAGVVLPHEETRPKARQDRLRLMRATQSNPEPIFGLYEDPREFVARTLEGATGGATPDLFAEVDGEEHRIWRVRGEGVDAVARFLRDARVWIADGHHRYETALAYRDERRAREGDPAQTRACDYILIVLSSFSDPGLVVLPTHRLVRGIPAGKMEQLLLQLERFFEVRAVPLEELADRMAGAPGEHRFGLILRDSAHVLTLRDPAVMDTAAAGHSAAWKRLDVSVLHALVLDRSLGISPDEVAATSDVSYTRSWEEAVESVRSGQFQVALMLNQPSADEVRQVAAAGDKMPPKSTYFYPKLWSGLVLRRV